jgi:DNA-binding beta-propeller fold protein YncE
VDGAGNIYVAGNHQPQISMIDGNGVVHIVAGLDAAGFAGDGGSARQALMDGPCGVAVASQGFPIYIADTNNHRIRMIGADGRITTIAGTGEAGFSGDGGPAVHAAFRHPYRVRFDEPTGNLYVCDTENHAVRVLDRAGLVFTVAGSGESGYSGDGGLATGARLSLPYDAVLGPDGALYIADTGNSRVRRVDQEGTITTIAGSGRAGFSGDGASARTAELDHPSALIFDDQGDILVSDTYNNRVRRITR